MITPINVYGIGKYSFNEEHEKEISNFYLTYGWDEKNNNKVKKLTNKFQTISSKKDLKSFIKDNK